MMGQDLRSCNRFDGQDTKNNRQRLPSLTMLIPPEAKKCCPDQIPLVGRDTALFPEFGLQALVVMGCVTESQ